MTQQEEDVLSLEDSEGEYFDTPEAGLSADEMEVPIPTLIFEAPLLLVISCPLNDLLTQFLSPLWNFPVLT
jgi:hypothetical protein